jgi:hypothetical protein
MEILFKCGGIEAGWTGQASRKSLELRRIGALDTLDGLQGLHNLTYFRWTENFSGVVVRTRMGQLPASLKVLQLDVGVLLRPDVFARCTSLVKLELRRCHAENLDFSHCTSLQSALLSDCRSELNLDFSNCASLRSAFLRNCHSEHELDFSNCTSLQSARLCGCHAKNLSFSNCPSLQSVYLTRLGLLQTVSGLSAAPSSNLHSLRVEGCYDLVEIPGLCHLVSLQHLHLRFNENFRKLPEVQMLTRLQVLEISDSAFDEVPGLGCLRQLRELRWTQIRSKGVSIKLPSLAEFEQLEVADFSSNWAIEQFGSCTGGLSALYLNLSDCIWLRRLPDLSG